MNYCHNPNIKAQCKNSRLLLIWMNLPSNMEQVFEIIRTKRFPIKPMTTEEAILQMNLLDHEFFVFKNQDNHGAFTVVYKRKSGGYGLIESND